MKVSFALKSLRLPLALFGTAIVLLSSAVTARALETNDNDIPVTPPATLGCVVRPTCLDDRHPCIVTTPPGAWCPSATAYPSASPSPSPAPAETSKSRR